MLPIWQKKLPKFKSTLRWQKRDSRIEIMKLLQSYHCFLSSHLNLICAPDLEEGVGNAHPNHALANSSQTKGGSSSPPPSEHGDGGDDEEKSVLQVKIRRTWFAKKLPLLQKPNPCCRPSWPTLPSTLATEGWRSPSSPSSSSSLDSPSTSSTIG